MLFGSDKLHHSDNHIGNAAVEGLTYILQDIDPTDISRQCDNVEEALIFICNSSED